MGWLPENEPLAVGDEDKGDEGDGGKAIEVSSEEDAEAPDKSPDPDEELEKLQAAFLAELEAEFPEDWGMTGGSSSSGLNNPSQEIKEEEEETYEIGDEGVEESELEEDHVVSPCSATPIVPPPAIPPASPVADALVPLDLVPKKTRLHNKVPRPSAFVE